MNETAPEIPAENRQNASGIEAHLLDAGIEVNAEHRQSVDNFFELPKDQDGFVANTLLHDYDKATFAYIPFVVNDIYRIQEYLTGQTERREWPTCGLYKIRQNVLFGSMYRMGRSAGYTGLPPKTLVIGSMRYVETGMEEEIKSTVLYTPAVIESIVNRSNKSVVSETVTNAAATLQSVYQDTAARLERAWEDNTADFDRISLLHKYYYGPKGAWGS